MLAKQLASIFLIPVLVLCTATALGEDFSKYDNEAELFKIVRGIPASDRSANADGYARLLALNPDNEFYWSRFERYSGSDESALFKVVRGIPASNRSANANGYARLLALDPNNDLYKTKLKKYAVPKSRPSIRSRLLSRRKLVRTRRRSNLCFGPLCGKAGCAEGR